MSNSIISIKEVTVVTRKLGPDLIYITLDDFDAFPNLKDLTTLEITTQKGCGVEWCKRHIGVLPRWVNKDGVQHEMEVVEGLTLSFNSGW